MNEDITEIQNRNKRVETDKAWEISKTRRIFIALITYIIACYYMRILGGSNITYMLLCQQVDIYF